MILPQEYHIPVLLNQVIDALKVSPGKKYIDATIGGGGYTEAIVKLGGRVLGIDIDKDAVDYVRQKFKIQNLNFKIGQDVYITQCNFKDLKDIAKRYRFERVDGVVFDLGLSTHQIESSGRGFSYRNDEALDMRSDIGNKLTAYEVINTYSEGKLYEIFTKYSEELNSGAIAHAIVRARSLNGPIESTKQLVRIIEQVLYPGGLYKRSKKFKVMKVKTLSRIFQSVRIAVNNEIDNLRIGIDKAVDLLNSEGRLAVLSYHSLEDRIVKLAFQNFKKKGIMKLITVNPITADYKEKYFNSKSRSAKLRVAEKI